MVEVSPAADPLPVALRSVAVVCHGLERLGRVSAKVASLTPLLPSVLLRLHALEGLRRGGTPSKNNNDDK